MQTVVEIISEWDIGLDGVVFIDETVAYRELCKAHECSGVEESLEECLAEGLYAFNTIKVIS